MRNTEKIINLIDNIFLNPSAMNEKRITSESNIKSSLMGYLLDHDTDAQFWNKILILMKNNSLIIRNDDLKELLKHSYHFDDDSDDTLVNNYLFVIERFSQQFHSAFTYADLKFLVGKSVLIKPINVELNRIIIKIFFPEKISSMILNTIAYDAHNWFGIFIKMKQFNVDKEITYIMTNWLCEEYPEIDIMKEQYLEQMEENNMTWMEIKKIPFSRMCAETLQVLDVVHIDNNRQRMNYFLNNIIQISPSLTNTYYVSNKYSEQFIEEIKHNPYINYKVESKQKHDFDECQPTETIFKSKIEKQNIICKTPMCEAVTKNIFGIVCQCNKLPTLMVKSKMNFYCGMEHCLEFEEDIDNDIKNIL